MSDQNPQLEPHWQPEDWADEGVGRNLLPWWIVLMWGLFLLWGLAYIVDSASAW